MPWLITLHWLITIVHMIQQSIISVHISVVISKTEWHPKFLALWTAEMNFRLGHICLQSIGGWAKMIKSFYGINAFHSYLYRCHMLLPSYLSIIFHVLHHDIVFWTVSHVWGSCPCGDFRFRVIQGCDRMFWSVTQSGQCFLKSNRGCHVLLFTGNAPLTSGRACANHT